MTPPPKLDSGRRQFHWDGGEQAFTITRSLDVTALLDQNAAERNHGSDGYTPSRDLRKIASIDVVTLDRWAQEDGLPVPWLRLPGAEFAVWVKRKLRDHTKFLTVEGL